MSEELVKTNKEKILLAEIFKQDGNIFIDFPNERDVQQYELYGFLVCYLELLKKDLEDSMTETEEWE